MVVTATRDDISARVDVTLRALVGERTEESYLNTPESCLGISAR